MKKNEINKLGQKETEAKIAEVEKAILEARGEGRFEKVKTLKKQIARLKTKKN